MTPPRKAGAKPQAAKKVVAAASPASLKTRVEKLERDLAEVHGFVKSIVDAQIAQTEQALENPDIRRQVAAAIVAEQYGKGR